MTGSAWVLVSAGFLPLSSAVLPLHPSLTPYQSLTHSVAAETAVKSVSTSLPCLTLVPAILLKLLQPEVCLHTTPPPPLPSGTPVSPFYLAADTFKPQGLVGAAALYKAGS